MIDIKSLPSELFVGDGIKLELDSKLHYGRDNLRDIEWYEYKIVNHEEKKIIYDNICLSFFRITEEIRLEASKNIIEKRVSYAETIRPHIDYNSGNVHPSKEFIKIHNTNEILQLVLCKGLGPNTKNQQEDNVYIYIKINYDKRALRFIKHAIIL